MNGVGRFAGALWLVVALSAGGAGAGEYSGLWVGTANLRNVSEVHKAVPDLGFDLGLDAVKERETLVASDGAWQVHDDGSDPGDDWEDPAFDDSPWSAGQAPFETPDAPPASYFRRSFDVADATRHQDLLIRLLRADGIVVYVNGAEILKNNLPSSFVGNQTLALSEVGEDPEDQLLELSLPATALNDGENVLAVEVHQAGLAGQTLAFELELSAGLVKSEVEALIPAGSAGWLYFDGAVPPAQDWVATDYVPNGWSSGEAPFGYGDGDETTLLTYPSAQRPATTWFRKSFDAPADAGTTGLRLLLLRDDGAVVYLNGEEVARSNMPEGAIEPETAPLSALTSADENDYLVVELSADDLLPTGNVVAVEIHQHPAELVGGSGAPALTRAGGDLQLRVLLHVDGAGSVRLLKEAILLYDEGNAQPVLVIDHERIPEFEGPSFRDGDGVGRRISAIGFDFEGHSLLCDGSFPPSAGTPLQCTIDLPSNHSSNPFLHRYHPDHDNWDSRYENVVIEAPAIHRELSLVEVRDTYPPGAETPEELRSPPPGWGFSVIGGQYQETVAGLHRQDIVANGSFELRRVARTEQLIPAE